VAEALANLAAKQSEHLRPAESLAVNFLKVIDATSLCSQIVITDIGRWEDVGGGNLAALPKYTAQVRGISFPFRPGATFYKEFSGRHAAAVNKPRVTIEFQFEFSHKHPESPIFTACDRDNKLFGIKFVADSPTALESK